MSKPNGTTQHFIMRSVTEASRETLVPEATIYQWIAEGVLPSVQTGRTTMVNILTVQSLSLYLPVTPGPRDWDWSRFYQRRVPYRHALGIANVLAGAASLVVFLGIGPDDLRTGWWLGLCLLSIVVGIVDCVLGSRPRAVGPRRATQGPRHP
jgi:excisionase family DNA binding protein